MALECAEKIGAQRRHDDDRRILPFRHRVEHPQERRRGGVVGGYQQLLELVDDDEQARLTPARGALQAIDDLGP